MSFQAPQVKVDAQNLWYLLQRYRNSLDNQCPEHLTLAEWREKGWLHPDYRMIHNMQQQIKEKM